MSTLATELAPPAPYPVDVRVPDTAGERNRLTTLFRVFLALPHIVLVGGPLAIPLAWSWTAQEGSAMELSGGGLLGAVAAVCALVGWFAILFTGHYPLGLRNLATFYLHWRVRAVAYTALLRDEYPPFGVGSYPVELRIAPAAEPRDRVTVAFRVFLAIPHLVAVWALGIAWFLATVVAWFAILFTGRYPEGLREFAVGALRWTTRVEAYLLLLHDRYPPFSLDEAWSGPAGRGTPE